MRTNNPYNFAKNGLAKRYANAQLAKVVYPATFATPK
jgi:hypothetical protein